MDILYGTLAVNWLNDNHTAANPGKFQGMVLSRSTKLAFLYVNNQIVQCTNKVKLIGVYVDDNLNCNDHNYILNLQEGGQAGLSSISNAKYAER